MPQATNTFRTTCCYCGVGCGIRVEQRRDGSLSMEGDPDHPVNRGMLCSKGRTLLHTVRDTRDRLLFPELRARRDQPRAIVSWDAAIAKAAAVFRETIAAHGPNSVGFYVSGQCLTEEYYLANKLAKGFLGTNNIDTNSRLCMSSAVAGYKLSLGEDSVPCSYEDIDLADLYFVAGANPAYCHPILFRRMEARLSADPRPVRMVVVDPRRTASTAMADLHLQIHPGTDITLFHALARRLIETGHADRAFVAAHTEGFKALREMVFARTVEAAATICRVPAQDLETAAAWIGEARGFLSMWAMGLNQSQVGVNKNLALINLHLLTGKIGKPGHGPFSLTGQPNAMGGREVGGLANLMSAHRDMNNPEHRAQIAHHWGVADVPAKPGFTAGEMMDALIDGRLKVLWIICTNPMVSWPDLGKAEAALRASRFLIVQDISLRSDTVPFADLVLPAAGWLEKSGTMTNSERRVSLLSTVVPPPGQALPDTEILLRFAKAMGYGEAFAFPNSAAIYDEHARLTQGTSIDVAGLNHARLASDGPLQWPVPTVDHPGTPRLFSDGQFLRPSGKAKLHAVPDTNTSSPADAEFPLVLTTGRIRDQWHTMTRTGKVAALRSHEPDGRLDIHPDDAHARSIVDGNLVTVASAFGQARVRARLSPDLKPGVVFLPMHFGRSANRDDARANNLTAPRWDPLSKQPDLKFTTVEVARYLPPRQRIAIVGAGAAALGFCRAYRRENPRDEVVIFSQEAMPFYDRVRLPHVVEDPLPWEALAMVDRAELADLHVEVWAPRRIVSIDREQKRIVDDEGSAHAYDTLVLATGSRAAWPKDTPVGQKGLHALRTYGDAEAILQSAGTGRKMVIVGGGLVGLETAGALRAKGLEVHLVHRTLHLMSKQLDPTAAGLLRDELQDRGIILHLNDQVIGWQGDGWISELQLATGETLTDVILIYAMGTVPNLQLAVAAGLAVNRGVVVDETMATSDPNILAIGEVAEFAGSLHGTSAAAEEQAIVAAKQLAGDVQAVYQGSLGQNILKIKGLALASIGLVNPPPDDFRYEEIVFLDRGRRVYQKCVIFQDRLVGALLMGDNRELPGLRDLIRNGDELGPRRAELLRSNRIAPVGQGGKTVCSCNAVDEGTLDHACQNGATTLPVLMAATGAGTGCGSCRPELVSRLRKTATN